MLSFVKDRPRRVLIRCRYAGALCGLAYVLAITACDGDPDDGDASSQCETAADCTILSSCCTGCDAATVGQTVEPCDAQCIQDPCEAEHGNAELSAICNQGTCEIFVAPEDPGQTACVDDADCKVLGDCCEGCVALHVQDSLPECPEACFADPCDPSGMGVVPQATCEQGVCELAEACTAAADCKVVSDCCLGCVAMPASATIPSCDQQCLQDPCIAEHGPEAVLTASCDGGACSIDVTQPGP
jgi:hypothetical protein